MFIEILFKMLLFKGGVLIYAEHCTCIRMDPKKPLRGAHSGILNPPTYGGVDEKWNDRGLPKSLTASPNKPEPEIRASRRKALSLIFVRFSHRWRSSTRGAEFGERCTASVSTTAGTMAYPCSTEPTGLVKSAAAALVKREEKDCFVVQVREERQLSPRRARTRATEEMLVELR